MSDPADRFRRRKRRRPALVVVPEPDAVQALLDAPGVSVEPLPVAEDGAALLARLEGQLDDAAVDRLLACCGRATVDALIRPFGLGALLFRATGWSEARQGELDQQRDNAALDYDYEAYHQGSADYVRARDGLRDAAKVGDLRDIYAPDRGLPAGGFHTEHIVAASTVHREDHRRPVARLAVSEAERARLANQSDNLGPTDGTLNMKKGRHDLLEWMDAPAKGHPGRTNAEVHGIDRTAALAAYADARAGLDDGIRARELQFAAATAWTAAREGVGLGVQQALGLVLAELVGGVFVEVQRLWREGGSEDTLLQELEVSMHRVVDRVGERRGDIWTAFGLGSLAGFLGSIATLVLNQVVGRVKNLARLVREGAMSVVRAGALLASPPEGVDRVGALHEASKVLAAGMAVGAGILAEEALRTALLGAGLAVPLLPFVGPVALVTGGLVAGLGAALAAHSLDRIDLLGVEDARRHTVLLERLTALLAPPAPRLLGSPQPA